MSKPIDCESNDEMVKINVSITTELNQLLEKEARKNCSGIVSMQLRKILRKHYGIKEKP